MKIFSIIIVEILLLACHIEKDKDTNKSLKGKSNVYSANSIKVRRWIEYKKVPVMNNRDTLPYANCYIVIKQDSFFYCRLNKQCEKRLLVKYKKYGEGVYIFKNKPDDLIFFSGKNDEYCQWTRSNVEGDYEYFKLSK